MRPSGPPIDTNYFETYNRLNVTLVDVKAAPIRQISEMGIRTEEAEYPVDIIVFATGFDAMTGPLTALNLRQVKLDARVSDGDEVALLPPLAGG
jgi:molybdopterin converting factor small subunit